MNQDIYRLIRVGYGINEDKEDVICVMIKGDPTEHRTMSWYDAREIYCYKNGELISKRRIQRMKILGRGTRVKRIA